MPILKPDNRLANLPGWQILVELLAIFEKGSHFCSIAEFSESCTAVVVMFLNPAYVSIFDNMFTIWEKSGRNILILSFC